MKRYLLAPLIALVAILAAAGAAAQDILPQLKRQTPDMSQIKRETTDRTSEYFYPRLMREHLGNDTTMKVEKYRRLYLGYMLQEDYNPYREHTLPQHIKALYQKQGKFTRQEADSVIKYAHRALDDRPFDLYQMLALVQAYRVKGKTNLAAIWNTKLTYILMAIISTGTGLDEKGAWWVMTPQHEYFLLRYLGYTPKGHTFRSPSYELITVTDPYGFKSGPFYFNIGTLLDTYYRKYE